VAEKPCKTCGRVKSLDSFPLNPKTRDGRRGECKDCYRARTRRLTKRWTDAHPERRRKVRATAEQLKAGLAVRAALRAKRIIRPVACDDCGNAGVRLEAHHDDYSKPLEIRWLCSPCHWLADEARRQQTSRVA